MKGGAVAPNCTPLNPPLGRAVLVAEQNDAMPEMVVGALEALLDLDTKHRFSRSNLAVPPYHDMSALLADAVLFADVEQAVAYFEMILLHRWCSESNWIRLARCSLCY